MLKNKIVFITGASSGIGEACAERFAERGAHLILVARQHHKLKAIANNLAEKFNIKVLVKELDVTDYDQVNHVFETLPPEWEDIDILINNAGLAAGLESIQEGDVSDWEVMIDTNLKGLLYVTKQVLPGMVKNNTGHVINIGSIAGHAVYPKGSVYCATKFAVNALTQGLRMDLVGTKVRVSTVDPGAVETNFSVVRFKGDIARAASVYQGMVPLSPLDVADAVLFCATRPLHVNISEIIIMPTDQAAVSMISRSEHDKKPN